MRKRAYIKAIKQAKKLPVEIPGLKDYFNDSFNPQSMAVNYILKKARLDVDALFNCEFVDIYNEEKNQNRQTQ